MVLIAVNVKPINKRAAPVQSNAAEGSKQKNDWRTCKRIGFISYNVRDTEAIPTEYHAIITRSSP